MFNIFNSKSKENHPPDWLPELQETEKRWFVFLEKLEAKMEELCTAAIPELEELFETDDDVNKMNFHRVYSGIMGQIENIRQKAYDAYEDKILNTYESIKSEVSVTSPHHNLVSEFRNRCMERYYQAFDKKLQYWREQIEATKEEDLEIKYQKILAEYEAIKHQFTCKQCGGGLTIDKIFFISTFITCPSCQTQNTFEPSTQARSLQFLAYGLAEQRVAHLLAAYQYQVSLERELYFQRHELSLSATFEKDKKLKAEKDQKIMQLTAQRQAAIDKAPELYKIYLRAKYDEINKILPDLKEHNEVRYQNELNSFRPAFT